MNTFENVKIGDEFSFRYGYYSEEEIVTVTRITKSQFECEDNITKAKYMFRKSDGKVVGSYWSLHTLTPEVKLSIQQRHRRRELVATIKKNVVDHSNTLPLEVLEEMVKLINDNKK